MSKSLAVVMAAGQGTRMKSDLPKVLVPVLGRPMIHYVLDAVEAAGIDETVVVVGYRAADVETELSARKNISFALQAERLGTGHAVMMARGQLAKDSGPALVLAGDSPMILASSLKALLADYEKSRPACIMGTAHKADPTGLGRILRDARGEFSGIVEEKDATPQQRKITEVNLSCYVFDRAELLGALEKLRADNAQKEYYLTDCPGLLQAAGKRVVALPILQPRESLSINTVDELAIVEGALRAQQ